MLETITLNVGAAAVPRAERILRWLERRHDHVIVLTETSSGGGTQLLSRELGELGYVVVATPASNDRGVLVASRVPVRARICNQVEVSLPWRLAGVRLATWPPIAVVGIYVPSRDRSPAKIARKEAFIQSFLAGIAGLPARTRRNLLIAGDYNVVSRQHDPPRSGYLPYEYEMLEELEALGFVSSHDLRCADEHPHTWIGRTGRGYLYDYIHVGVGMRERLGACRYVHDTRTLGLSDHAAVAAHWRLNERPLVFGNSAAPTASLQAPLPG